jgi:hypothetical protein
MSYSYKVLNKWNRWEDWSGNFNTEEQATKWYNRHGKFHEARGHKLKLFKDGITHSNF